MADGTEFSLKIDAEYKPETFPMKRLAEYMHEFAKLLGSEQQVHFQEVRGGSAVLLSFADPVAEPKVTSRLYRVSGGAGPNEAKNASQKIDDMLAEDNGIGTLFRGTAKIIEFPGRLRPKAEILDLVRQRECLDGELVQIGGRDDSIPVHLYNSAQGVFYRCNIAKDKARGLAVYLFGPKLRVFGDAIWKRDVAGTWGLKDLWIDHYVVLDQESISQTLQKLRAIPGNDWDSSPDAIAELIALRHESEVAS
jgi:hypothetical protein